MRLRVGGNDEVLGSERLRKLAGFLKGLKSLL